MVWPRLQMAALTLAALTVVQAGTDLPVRPPNPPTVWVGHWPLDRVEHPQSGLDRTKAYFPNLTGGPKGEFVGTGPMPKLIQSGDGAELRFPGRDRGGCVAVLGGSQVLFGPRFRICCDVKMLDPSLPAIILSCKGAAPMGGFRLTYSGGGHTLQFEFSDGKNNYRLPGKLKEPMPKEKWVSIAVTYDHADLVVKVDDRVIGKKSLPGRELVRNIYNHPLLIGGYGARSQLLGSIRNVRLGILVEGESAPGTQDTGAYVRSKGFELPDMSRIRVGIYGADYNMARAAEFRRWLREKGVASARILTTTEIMQDGALDPAELEVLIVPGAAKIPLAVWELIPPYVARKGHVIFEECPETPWWGRMATGGCTPCSTPPP